MTDIQKKKRRSLIYLALALIVMAAAGVALGGPALKLAADPQHFRQWVQEQGFLGQLAFVGMVILQIVVAAIPGEPLEIAAGYAFGVTQGTILCLTGSAIGGGLVFLLVRRFGMPLVELFFSKEKIQKIENLPLFKEPEKLYGTMVLLFLIPGTPKDLITYIAGLTRMRLIPWLLITGLVRFPSVITSTLGGNALDQGSWGFAAIVFGGTAAVSLLGLWLYRRISKANAQKT